MSLTAETILRDFRDRRITYAEFEREMRPWLEIDFAREGLSIRYRQSLGAHVTIAPGDVRRAIAAFTANEFPENEFVRWATMLDVLTEFGPEVGISDEDADRLDPMWDVLVRVGSPRLFGALAPQTVAGYDERLRELESDLSRRAV